MSISYFAEENGDSPADKILLSGWTLLQETCAMCNYQLFRNSKKESVIICVNCDVATKKRLPKGIFVPDAIMFRSIASFEQKINAIFYELSITSTTNDNVDYHMKLSSLLLQMLKIKGSYIE